MIACHFSAYIIRAWEVKKMSITRRGRRRRVRSLSLSNEGTFSNESRDTFFVPCYVRSPLECPEGGSGQVVD